MKELDDFRLEIQAEFLKDGFDLKKIMENEPVGKWALEKLAEERFYHFNGYFYTEAYDPKFGDNRKCTCGHAYYRHFDTYSEMFPCGCKYCQHDGALIPNPDDPKPSEEVGGFILDEWHARQKYSEVNSPDHCCGFQLAPEEE